MFPNTLLFLTHWSQYQFPSFYIPDHCFCTIGNERKRKKSKVSYLPKCIPKECWRGEGGGGLSWSWLPSAYFLVPETIWVCHCHLQSSPSSGNPTWFISFLSFVMLHNRRFYETPMHLGMKVGHFNDLRISHYYHRIVRYHPCLK